jgi:hypothetical protein
LPASSDHEKRTDAVRRIHLETNVSSLLAQFYLEAGRRVVCYDADPVNASLTAITALAARPVKLFKGDRSTSVKSTRSSPSFSPSRMT